MVRTEKVASERSRTAGDAAVRACVLAGAGKSFCAGADIGWMARMVEYSEDDNRRDARALAAMFEALDTLPQPLIGRVHGAALGGGTGLAAVCDLVVASPEAAFGFTEVKLGILPAVISPYCVAKIGAGHGAVAAGQAVGLVPDPAWALTFDATGRLMS